MAIINGTSGPDDLSSSNPGDVILGLDGDDVLAANATNITLDGGAGVDQLFSFVGDSKLIGGAGDDLLFTFGTNDVINYSFNLTQGSGGGSATPLKFTDWLSMKFGTDFGDHLPDYVRGHDKHGKDDKGGKDDKHGKDDKDHQAKDQDHKHGKDDGHHDQGHDDAPSADTGLTQSFFSKNYTEWLKDVVVADLVAQGLVQDVNGNGKIDIGLNQNDPAGTPFIEGLSAAQLAGMFSDRDGVLLKTGEHTQERFYSNTFTPASGGGTTTTVTSGDGLDTIADFTWGADQLQFQGLGGLTLDQFTSFFALTEADVNGDTIADTTLGLADNTWGVTLLGVSGHTEAEFFSSSVFA